MMKNYGNADESVSLAKIAGTQLLSSAVFCDPAGGTGPLPSRDGRSSRQPGLSIVFLNFPCIIVTLIYNPGEAPIRPENVLETLMTMQFLIQFFIQFQ